MSENLELQLGTEYKASQEKYCYFLLAAAASAIGFAITQLKIEPLQYHHIPLGISVALWAISFISGMQVIEYAGSLVFQNHNYLAFKRELRSFYKGSDAAQQMASFKSIFNETVDKQSNRLELYGKLQKWSLLLGGLAYIVWHAVQMWALNEASPSGP